MPKQAKTYTLSDVETEEVSLVGKGAVPKSKFLIVKADEESVDLNDMSKLKKQLTDMESYDLQWALSILSEVAGFVRSLHSAKEYLPDELKSMLEDMMEAVGVNPDSIKNEEWVKVDKSVSSLASGIQELCKSISAREDAITKAVEAVESAAAVADVPDEETADTPEAVTPDSSSESEGDNLEDGAGVEASSDADSEDDVESQFEEAERLLQEREKEAKGNELSEALSALTALSEKLGTTSDSVFESLNELTGRLNAATGNSQE